MILSLLGMEMPFIDKESELGEIFNVHYINTIDKTSGVLIKKKYVIDTNNTQKIFEEMSRKYERHSIILKT